MDRRAAIRRLAVGGLTVTTASMVRSTPAFANGVIPPDDVFLGGTFGAEIVTMLINTDAPTCTGSQSGPGTIPEIGYSAVLVNAYVADPFLENVKRDTSYTPGTDFGLVIARGVNISPSTASVTFAVEYACPDTGGTVCRSWVVTSSRPPGGSWTRPVVTGPGDVCPGSLADVVPNPEGDSASDIGNELWGVEASTTL